MKFPPATFSKTLPPEGGPDFRKDIADLVRSFVFARRGASRIAACEWVRKWLGIPRTCSRHSAVEAVIETLCEVGDIGSGHSHGEPVLFALPVRHVLLPDGSIIALGDHGLQTTDESDLLFPMVSGKATLTLLDILDTDEAIIPDDLPAFGTRGTWPADQEMPFPVRRALTLCSAFDRATRSWSMSEENAFFLNDLFRSGADEQEAISCSGNDKNQQLIIMDAPHVRTVVEAGPGTGKTWVACERVKRLVTEDGLAPARVVLLSFTRLAIAEIRHRIERDLPDMAGLASLQILTFDSFAARLNHAYGKGITGGYDEGIRTATRILNSDDYLVADFIGQIEHLIIDEAQDLVGDRKALCHALLKLLNESCGVTVFGDFAQSIYGYQAPENDPDNFLSEVAKRPNFRARALSTDHRTKTPLLRDMFLSVRQVLRGDLTRDTYFDVREKIRDGATENDIADFSSHASTTRGMILTRSRAGLFAAADAMRACGRHFRIHLPDRPLRVEPWIGAMLGGLPANQVISRDDFEPVYNDLHPPCARNIDECWHILKDLDGSGRSAITVGRVAEALEEPPVELIGRYEGKSGPLLSTIHSQKGGEDQRVLLLLTRAPARDETDWGEEARTLYVGASRAVSELRTGWINPARLYKSGTPERYWSARADHRLVEAGLDEDLIDWGALVKSKLVSDVRKTIGAIWSAAVAESAAEAVTDSKGNLILKAAGGQISLGCFSEKFCTFIQEIRQVSPDVAMPARITGFSVSGATTVVVPGDGTGLPGLSLMPLLGGFARVAR